MKRVFLILILLLSTFCSYAHELQENRLTLVLHDKHHLVLIFWVNYVEILHRILAPQQTLEEFILVSASVPPEAFEKSLLQVQQMLENKILLMLPENKPVKITHWNWPEASQVQAMFRDRTMQTIVAPSDHHHGEFIEIHAEAYTAHNVKALNISLPPEVRPILVVSYQPEQVWMNPKIKSIQIKFR